MSILEDQSAVTNTVTNHAVSILPTTRLASPYHYRRNGIYYVRIRETGSTVRMVSLSLHTSDKRDAMNASSELTEAVRAFHQARPEATWQQLKERVIGAAAASLRASGHLEPQRLWGDFYANGGIFRPVINNGQSLGYAEQAGDALGKQRETLFVPVRLAPLTFEALSKLYMVDRAGEQKPNTLSSTKFTHGVLGETLGLLDLHKHSRADLVSLRDTLVKTRKPSTVNQMLMKFSAVMTWAVENGHLEKSFDKKLKFTKGLESSRKVFTQDQVVKLVTYSNTLPEGSWKRWLLSLGAITGARLNEISQLTVSDVLTLEPGITAIHINEAGEGKSIKNKRSERLVPLTNGAYGFDLAAFLRYVEACKGSGEDSLAQIGYRPSGEWANQQAIPAALGDAYERGLVFHSMRHSLASLMQAKGVPTAYAQAVMGHASGTITFDVYGSGVPVETIAEMLAELFAGAARR